MTFYLTETESSEFDTARELSDSLTPILVADDIDSDLTEVVEGGEVYAILDLSIRLDDLCDVREELKSKLSRIVEAL